MKLRTLALALALSCGLMTTVEAATKHATQKVKPRRAKKYKNRNYKPRKAKRVKSHKV